METTALRNTIPDGELNTEKYVSPPPPTPPPITYLRKGAFQQISYNQQSSFTFPSDSCSLLSHLTFYKAVTSRLVQTTEFYMLLTSSISQLFKTQFRILFPTHIQVIFLPPCCETLRCVPQKPTLPPVQHNGIATCYAAASTQRIITFLHKVHQNELRVRDIIITSHQTRY